MPFSRVYLEITNCCNLACSFCPGIPHGMMWGKPVA